MDTDNRFAHVHPNTWPRTTHHMLTVNALNKHVGFFIPAADVFDPFVAEELAEAEDNNY